MRRQVFVALTILLACHFAATFAYLFRFPAWRAPDEGAHFAYIQHLSQTGELPVFYGKWEGTYEAHQPPLYYLTALPFTHPFTRSNEPNLTALYLARFVSTLWGALGVVCAFLLGLRLGSESKPTLPFAFLVGSFAALFPVHLLVCASVGNDATAGATSALTLLWLCHICLASSARTDRQKLRDVLIAGFLSGLALLAKSSNIALLPLAFIALAAIYAQSVKRSEGLESAPKKRKSEKQLPKVSFNSGQFSLGLLLMLSAFLAAAGWWLWRNFALYSDPLAVKAFIEGFKDSPRPSDFLEPGGRYARYGTLSLTTYITWVVQITLFTWLGIYGEPNEAVKGLARLYEGSEPDWAWVLLAAALGVTAISFIVLGGVRVCQECFEALKERKFEIAASKALPLLLFLLIFLEFVQFNRHFFQAQARYFYPAHAATSYLFAVGVFRVVPPRWAWQVSIVCFSVLTLLSLLVWWKWAGL